MDPKILEGMHSRDSEGNLETIWGKWTNNKATILLRLTLLMSPFHTHRLDVLALWDLKKIEQD